MSIKSIEMVAVLGFVVSGPLLSAPAGFADGFAIDGDFASVEVEGLVLIGRTFSGTSGWVVDVAGILLCSTGQPVTAVLEAAGVPLDEPGEVGLADRPDEIAAPCADAVFLIRIATLRGTNPDGADESWTVTGAEHSIRHN